MSKFICELDVEILDAVVNNQLEIDPKNYLYCDTREELINAIQEDLDYSWSSGDIDYDNCYSNYNIPEDFIEAWEKLRHDGK